MEKSKNKRTGLGKGISALIPQTEDSRAVDVFFEQNDNSLLNIPGAQLANIQINEIVPNQNQPRTEFSERELLELSYSIKEFGVLQPIVVRISNNKNIKEKYELVMGERRLRASKLVNLQTIPAIIRNTSDDAMLRDALLENLHRVQLNPLEEASAYKQLLEDFGITQEELALKIGRSRSQIANTIRLLQLPENIQKKVASGDLSAGHARTVLSVNNSKTYLENIVNKIINEGISVRETEKLINDYKKPNKPKAGDKRIYLDEISSRLSNRLDTKVNIKLGSKKGQLIIDFITVQDLNRILNELGDAGFTKK